MIKLIIRTALLMALTGCAGSQFDEMAAPASEAGAEAVILAEPIAPDTSCEDPGDGIGGTGCSVD